MQFEYEIPVNEYVAAQMLYRKLSTDRSRFRQLALWGIAGSVFIINWIIDPRAGWTSFVLAVIGAWWFTFSLQQFFPKSLLRSQYPKSRVAGKRYSAVVTEDGFEVAAENCRWYLRWAGVTTRGEDDLVFMFEGANTIFMFGKKFLTEEQQQTLRRYTGLQTV